MKKSKVVLLVAGAFILVGSGVGLMTGLYIDPPIPKKSPGQTVWFYRRLVRTPFMFSTDSIALQNGAVPTEEIRAAISKNVQARIARFVLARFPFNRMLYLNTTGNRDFIRVQEGKGSDGPADD
jgi:hypothetical protein